MKAIIKDLRKETLPQFNATTNQDEPTVMVVAEIEFISDQGELVHTQIYAHTPEEASHEYYQRQADAMQADLDQESDPAVAAAAQANQLADEKIAVLRLHLGDGVPLNDRK
jgi:hypothetical protein